MSVPAPRSLLRSVPLPAEVPFCLPRCQPARTTKDLSSCPGQGVGAESNCAQRGQLLGRSHPDVPYAEANGSSGWWTKAEPAGRILPSRPSLPARLRTRRGREEGEADRDGPDHHDRRSPYAKKFPTCQVRNDPDGRSSNRADDSGVAGEFSVSHGDSRQALAVATAVTSESRCLGGSRDG